MKIRLSITCMFLLVAAFNLNAQNDAISRFFRQYAEDERFTVVYVAPKLFSMISKVQSDDEEWNQMREIVKDLGGLRVLVADSVANGLELFNGAISKIPVQEYDELVTVRDGDEHVRIWTRENKSDTVIEELLLLVGAPDEFVMLSLMGKIDLEKISGLSESLDVEGIEHLDKLKKKKE
ncbi:MAG: hypothetical protein RJA20_2379 [Bacteroidota bacterium]|jgi:hypothetical protein